MSQRTEEAKSKTNIVDIQKDGTYNIDTSFLGTRSASSIELDELSLVMNFGDFKDKLAEKGILTVGTSVYEIREHLLKNKMFPLCFFHSLGHIQQGFDIMRPVRDDQGKRTGDKYKDNFWRAISGEVTCMHDGILYVPMIKFYTDGQIKKLVSLEELGRVNSIDYSVLEQFLIRSLDKMISFISSKDLL